MVIYTLAEACKLVLISMIVGGIIGAKIQDRIIHNRKVVVRVKKYTAE